ncbi:MAG: tetratricopeptide repeat protein [Nitrospirae bacterium]|nr:tetratricopeptide repeat protein [Nitrospirota bacterium]
MSDRTLKWFQYSIMAIIVALVWVAHGGAVNGGFHYDDFHAIVNNPSVRAWDPLSYFTSSKGFSSGGEGGNYRPVTVTSFALDVLVGGMRPGHFLLVNLILHAVNTWLVYLIGRRLLRNDRWAAVAAVVYAIHPVNAEAVNYVVARSSLVSSFLTLVAFWALLRRDEGMRGGLGVAVAAFSLALLSKEAALSLLPPVVFKGWLNQRNPVRPEPVKPMGARVTVGGGSAIWKWDVPVILIFVGVSALFVVLWRFMSSGTLLATIGGGAAYPGWTFIEIVVRGVWLWVWPWPLGLDHPLVFARQFDTRLAVFYAGGIGALVVLAAWSLRREPLVVWSVVWILAGFLPLLPIPWLTTRGLFQENRLVFSAAALAWLTAWALDRCACVCMRLIRSPVVARAAVIGVGGAFVLGAVVIDRGRTAVWNDDVRLWEEVTSRRPDDYLAHVNLGVAYLSRRMVDEATRAFERASGLAPDSPLAALNLGQIYQRQNRSQDAELVFQDAIARWNRRPQEALSGEASRVARGMTVADSRDVQGIRFALGELYLARHDLAGAQAAYEDAARADASDFRAWYNLGVVAERRGNVGGARDAYRRALEFAPQEAKVASALERIMEHAQ